MYIVAGSAFDLIPGSAKQWQPGSNYGTSRLESRIQTNVVTKGDRMIISQVGSESAHSACVGDKIGRWIE